MKKGKPAVLTPADLRTIWLRYALYEQNRPGKIARDYNITDSYVIQIGRRKDPCQRPLPTSQLLRSRLISTQRTSNGQSVTGVKDGHAR